jgi:hypothetical protein
LNGKKLDGGGEYGRLKVINIRASLLDGANCLAAEAVNTGDSPNPAGLFVYALLRGDHSGKSGIRHDFGTDASWSCSAQKSNGWQQPDFAADNWSPASELGDANVSPWALGAQFRSALAAPEHIGKIRAVLANADPLQVALGRPNREQTVTTRLTAATTLQALELTNGHELSELIQHGAQNLMGEYPDGRLIPQLYARALGRKPTREELKLAREVVGQPAQPAGVEDLLWTMAMLPEFQLIY